MAKNGQEGVTLICQLTGKTALIDKSSLGHLLNYQ